MNDVDRRVMDLIRAHRSANLEWARRINALELSGQKHHSPGTLDIARRALGDEWKEPKKR